MSVKTVIKSMRGPFLILTPVCVLLGVSSATNQALAINYTAFTLALLGALLAHISVNTLNEYYDFKSGLDINTLKTPFSGGSGALPQNPASAHAVLSVGIISLLATSAIGVFFVWQQGVAILPIGILGLLIMLSYTGWINKHPLICLIAPGIGFGFLMVLGTQFVLSGEFTTLSWLVALVPFFLVNNLLLLNQYPDIQADTKAGRYHLPIAFGIDVSNKIYALFVLLTIVVIIGCIVLGYFPMLSIIALLPLPLAFYALSGAIKHKDSIGLYPQFLAANVAVTLMTPFLLSLSLWLN